jgi:hypothetical protein
METLYRFVDDWNLIASAGASSELHACDRRLTTQFTSFIATTEHMILMLATRVGYNRDWPVRHRHHNGPERPRQRRLVLLEWLPVRVLCGSK